MKISLTQADVSSNEIISEINTAIATAEKINKKVNEINDNYLKALNKGDAKTAKNLYDKSRQLNAGLLETFKFAQDHFVKLTWEDEPIFPHEHAQNNIENLALSIEALKKGDVNTPLDEYLFAIDNNWYTYDFDKEVNRYFTDYVLKQPADRLLWGAGRIVGHEDLYDTINSLLEKRDQTDANVTEEIETLTKALENQKRLLKTSVDEEHASIKTLSTMLTELK